MPIRTLLFLLSVCFAFSLHAQTGFSEKNGGISCGEHDLMRSFLRNNPAYQQRQNEIESRLLADGGGVRRPSGIESTVTIPVVVHIIHNNGPENISDARVLTAIQHLNEAYENSGYYDQGNGVNTNIQFCMAQRDPNNNLTNGITRDVSPFTNMGGPDANTNDQNVKNINRWNPNCYLNIWIVNSIPGSVVGYAYLPSAAGSSFDGLVIEAGYFGGSYANDVVVVHETGHYLGLYHTFEGGCSNNNCATDGDRVCDTPPDNSTSYTSCGQPVNSCSTDILSGFTTDQNDLTEDYMDYGNFNCMSVFTQGQSDRMNWVITNVRSSLLNCQSCQPPCSAPVSTTFTASAHTAPAGTTISFTSASTNASGYTWYVNGTAMANTANYSQQFTQAGTYYISLIAASSNPAQCANAEKKDTVYITCSTVAGFTPGINGVTAVGTALTFTNTSSGATSYQWFFDNNPVATTPNYTATFGTTGTHFIKLRASSTYCVDSFMVYYIVNDGSGANGGNISFQRHFERNENIASPLTNYSGLLMPNEDILVAGGLYDISNSTNWVERYTNQGQVVWARRYEKSGQYSRIDAAIPAIDGNYFLVGDNYNGLVQLFKINGNGTLLGSWYLAGGNFNDIIQAGDGSLYILSTENQGSNNSLIDITKFNTSLTAVWEKQITGSQSEGKTLMLAGNGLYMAGSTTQGSNNWDALLAKLDPATGALQFVKRYDAHGTPNKVVNMAMLGSKILLNGVINNSTGYPSNVKTLSLVDLAGNVISGKEIQNAAADGSGVAQLVSASYKLFVATTNANNGRVYLDKMDSSLNFIGGRVYLQNNDIVTVSKIHELSAGSVIITGNVGLQHTLVIRTLPDLSTPGCNDSSYLPSLNTAAFTGTDVTAAFTATSIQGNSAFTNPFTEVNTGARTRYVCTYTPPVAPLCDSAMVQNVYQTTDGGISGSAVFVLATARRTNKNILTAYTSNSSVCLMETDQFGNKISYRQFPGFTSIRDVKNTSDGGYIVMLYNQSGSDNFSLVKFNPSGSIQWSKTYHFTGNPGNRILVTSDGYVAIASNNLIKLDAGGTVVYAITYQSAFGGIPSIIEDGNALVFSAWGSVGNVVKIDKATGAQLWSTEGGIFQNIIKSGSSYIATAGFYSDTSGFIAKMNTAGTYLLMKTVKLPGSTFWDHKTITAGPAGQFLIMSNAANYSSFNNNRVFLTYIDSSLNFITGAASYGSFAASGTAITADANGYIYPAGILSDYQSYDVFQYIFQYKFRLANLAPNCLLNPAVPVLQPWPNNTTTPGTIFPVALTITGTSNTINLSTAELFTTNVCVAENCPLPLACDTIGCSLYKLSGPVNICHLTDTIIVHLNKTPGCTLAPFWTVSGTAVNTIGMQNDSTIKILCSSAGSLLVKARTTTACKVFEDTLRVNVFNAPAAVNLGADVQLCPGSIATFHAGSGFVEYQWQDLSTDSVFSTNQPGMYFVKVKDNCGNQYHDTVNVSITAMPPFDLGPDKDFCSSDSLVLTAPAGFTNYLWAPNYGANTVYGATIKVKPAADTMYTVTATYASGCTVIDSIRVHIKVAAVINLGADTSFCSGGSKQLTPGNGFTSYSWSTGAATPAITVSSVGTYWVEATNANGCISRDTMKVLNVYPKPNVSLGPDAGICSGQSLVLNPGTGYASYLWQDGTTNPTYPATQTGLYWVEVSNSFGCKSRDSLTVPTILASTPISLGTDQSICENASLVLTPGSGFASYTWQDNSHLPSYSAISVGTYWVKVTNQNGCASADTMKILSLYPKPVVDLGPDTKTICRGDHLVLDAGVGQSGYSWQDGSTAQFYTASQMGLYKVTVTNSFGCVNKDSLRITALLDTPKNFIEPVVNICKSLPKFTVPTQGYSAYLWSTGSTADSILIITEGNYWLQVTDAAGCKGKENFTTVEKDCLTAIYFPNTFTPNGDHLNDVFRPKLFGECESFRMEVYNRYGARVFETTNPLAGWDGRISGQLQNTGAYVWIATYKLKNYPVVFARGTVMLLR